MNLIDRLADIKIDAWFKSSPRKPMVLRGARQVGKTHLVRAFAKRNQLVLCELNFERRPQLAELFKSDLSPKDILRRIEIIEGVSFDGNTLLFFDEVQECPRALTSIRYFYEESPQVPLVAAGSLLEFILNNSSLPVGRTTFLRLFPLSFEEFLRATNKKHLADELPSFPSKPFNLGLTIHQNYMSAFKEYSLVGGMPEAVARFCETNSFHSATQVHKDLATSYLDDIRKYGLGDLQLK